MLIRLGTLYLDSIADSAADARPGLINRVPEPNETGVYEDGAIYLTVVDTGVAGLAAGLTTIEVTDALGTVLAWDGVAFHADYATSSFVSAVSDGAGPDDEHRFILRRATDFASLDTITVDVHAETVDAQSLDTSYAFQIRDYTAPVVDSIRTRGLKQIELNFDEAVVQGTDEVGDALRIRSIYSAELVAPSDLRSPVDVFETDDVGLYVAIAGADTPINNRVYRVSVVGSTKQVTLVDAQGNPVAVGAEVLPRDAVVTIGPYGLEGVVSDEVTPIFAPIITSAQAGSSAAQVLLNLHAELSPGGSYKFSTHKVEDLFGNQLLNDDPPFAAEPLSAPPRRSFDLVNALPPHNLTEDYTHDLEKLLRSIQDVASVLLSDVDKFAEIVDVDLAPESFLDALLYHLGNPFAFAASLTPGQKRMLLDVLVEIYQRNGTESGIEAVINFFLGVAVTIQAYMLDDIWILGESELGFDTNLGPGTSFLRYAFEAVSPVALTQTQRDRLRDIVNYMKPAHTHFMRIVEP